MCTPHSFKIRYARSNDSSLPATDPLRATQVTFICNSIKYLISMDYTHPVADLLTDTAQHYSLMGGYSMYDTEDKRSIAVFEHLRKCGVVFKAQDEQKTILCPADWTPPNKL